MTRSSISLKDGVAVELGKASELAVKLQAQGVKNKPDLKKHCSPLIPAGRQLYVQYVFLGRPPFSTLLVLTPPLGLFSFVKSLQLPAF